MMDDCEERIKKKLVPLEAAASGPRPTDQTWRQQSCREQLISSAE